MSVLHFERIYNIQNGLLHWGRIISISGAILHLSTLETHLIEQGITEKINIFIYAISLFFLGSSRLKPVIRNIFLIIVLCLMVGELEFISDRIEENMITIGFYMDKKISFFIRAVIAPVFLVGFFFLLYNLHIFYRLRTYISFKTPYSYTLITALCCIFFVEVIAETPDFLETTYSINLSSNFKIWYELVEEILEFSIPLLLLLGFWQFDQYEKNNEPIHKKQSQRTIKNSPNTSFPAANIPLKKLFVMTLFFGVCGAIIFILFPKLDILAANAFFTKTGGFAFKDPTLGYHLRHLLMEIYGYAILIAIFGCMFSWFFKKSFFSKTNRQMLFFLAMITIGPGLVANLVLKNHWGRARPVHIQEFGGTKNFTPPYVFSHNCRKNCSFISGEASNFFALFFGLALISRRFWKALYLSGIGAGMFAGYIRMGAGGHFLSDVFFAGIFMSLTCLTLYWLLLPNRLPAQNLKS